MDSMYPECAASSFGPANNLITTFLSAIVAIHCNITTPDMWPQDYGPEGLDIGLEEYDYVIIGAGTAGSLVAGRLAENGYDKILLVEAGGDPPMESEIPGLQQSLLNTEFDWQYPIDTDEKCRLEQKENALCVWSKGKLLGGSQSMDHMIYLRGYAQDFDDWELAGNPSWGWNDVLYHFRKIEYFSETNTTHTDHGVQGVLNVEPFNSPKIDQFMLLEAAKELGYEKIDDFIAGKYVGFGRYFGTLKDGRRMTTAKAFLTTKQPNLHIIKHAIAAKINVDLDLRAESVSVVYKGVHDLLVKAKKEIILSAGTIESPKLLMLSGIGPKAHLSKVGIPLLQDLPVGNNLQDHVRVEFILKLNYRKELGLDSQLLDAIFNQWVHRKGQLAAPIIDVTGFIATQSIDQESDIQILFEPVFNVSEFKVANKDRIIQSALDQVKTSDRLIIVWVMLQRPKSKGFVRLRSAYYQDYPYIFPNYLHKVADLKTLVRGIRKLLQFEKTATFKRLEGQFLRMDIPDCDDLEYQSSDYWECYVRTKAGSALHAVGTAKMGPSLDETSVVNSRLEVIGVKGLRVVDASVMPSIVSVGTGATTMMIAEKAADFIKSEWMDYI